MFNVMKVIFNQNNKIRPVLLTLDSLNTKMISRFFFLYKTTTVDNLVAIAECNASYFESKFFPFS